ncbi:fimbria/pilus periplasmic chaperone [Pantoea rwandensis]|nr:fimbria/pilus periplasmic chaperone [Pantoea sp. alder69]MCA1253590.1 fimbria/pilus periplasmic chaperone [Pantoea sp. alder70]MCA1268294.1 fimbria/pilus periplasmic chaperone [Pantoea sp. alder81]
MLKNDSDHPALVLMRTDEGEIDRTPDSIIPPVIALPPVSKVFGGELRSIMLIVTSRRQQKK